MDWIAGIAYINPLHTRQHTDVQHVGYRIQTYTENTFKER